MHDSGASRRGVVNACSPSLRGALATKQSILSLRGEMDCFASLAMTAQHLDCLWLFEIRKPSLRGPKRRSNPSFFARRDGLLRGTCHRARICATRSLAMTVSGRARYTLNRRRPRKRAIQYSETSVIELRSRGVLDTPWVHDTSATPARVLWRWDNVMASSALKSALRSTACTQAVDLKTKLLLRLSGRRRRSVGNCGATPGLPRSGWGARSLSGPSNWPSAGAGGMAASSWRASRTCGTAWAKALRWDIPQSRSLADWRWNMVASSSAMINLSFHLSPAGPKGSRASPAAAPQTKTRAPTTPRTQPRQLHQTTALDHRTPRRGRRPRDAGPLGSRLHARPPMGARVSGSPRTTNPLQHGSAPGRSKSYPHRPDHRSSTR